MPILAKDDIKDALLRTVGARDRARSRELGRAAYGVLFAVAKRILDAGQGLVLEGNFSRGISETDLLGLTGSYDSVLVHCRATKKVIAARLSSDRGDRHEGHFDRDVLPEVLTAIDEGVYEPVEIGCPPLVVETDEGYEPSRRQIVDFCR